MWNFNVTELLYIYFYIFEVIENVKKSKFEGDWAKL